MGTMSASDAAPLPRLGEVFFDVRGNSRTMRVSWYADTGVAVFSIWQGDTCTGTFRLPIPELPRMIEALAQGPPDAAGPGSRMRAPGPRMADPGPPTTAMGPPGTSEHPDDGYPDPGPGWSYGEPRDRYEHAPLRGGPAGEDDGYDRPRPRAYQDHPPATGYMDEVPGGFGPQSPGGYQHVSPRGYEEMPRRGYQDPSPAGYGGPEPDRYPDVPPGRHQDVPPDRFQDPLAGGYQDPLAGGYQDPPPGRHSEPPPGGWGPPASRGYAGSAPEGGYPGTPAGGHPSFPPGRGYGTPDDGYGQRPAAPGGFEGHRDAARPPSGPLPVGRWRADEPGAGYSGPAPGEEFAPEDDFADEYPPGDEYRPEDEYRPDPLGGDYHDEAEQGYLPGPPTDTFPAAPPPGRDAGNRGHGGDQGPGTGRREREYGHSRGRS